MKTICLVGLPSVHSPGSCFPPLTLVHLASVLKSRQPSQASRTRVIDLQLSFTMGRLQMGQADLHERIVADIMGSGACDILLFATMCNNLPLAISLAQECKRRDENVVVVIGGLHASLVAEQIVEAFEAVDIVVRGEGERTLLELVDALLLEEAVDGIRGITFADGDRVASTPDRGLIEDLDELPMPDFDVVPSLSEYQPEREPDRHAAFIDVGRGCPLKCGFCAAALMWQHTYRQKSARRILREMKLLSEERGVRHFFFNQDEFLARGSVADELCGELRRAGLSADWRIYARLDSLDSEAVRRLSAGGCAGIFVGVESASGESLRRVRKRVPTDRAVQTVERLLEARMECIASFILGFPWEKRDDIDATLSLALEMALRGAQVNLQLLTPHPGTDLWDQYGHDLVLHEHLYPHYDNSEFLSPKEHALIGAHPEIFTVFYNYRTELQPFESVFNLYYDYNRLINPFARLIHDAVASSGMAMTDLHTRFRETLSTTAGVSRHSVVESDMLADEFGSFVRGLEW